jgi:hypothetical protein
MPMKTETAKSVFRMVTLPGVFTHTGGEGLRTGILKTLYLDACRVPRGMAAPGKPA